MGSFQSFLLQGPDIKDNMTLILLSLAQITQPSRRGADGRRREVALWPELKKSSKNSIQLVREGENFHPLIPFLRPSRKKEALETLIILLPLDFYDFK